MDQSVGRFRPTPRVGMMSGVPELTIDTLDGRVAVPDSWLAFVARELREPDRYVVVKDGRRHSYAQVFNNEGTLLLEYRDGSPRRHFQVEGVGIGEVADALSQWSRGERGFVDGHQWTRLTDWDGPEDGSSAST